MAIIEGKNPVTEALKAGRRISRILLSKTLKPDESVIKIRELAQSTGVRIELTDRESLYRISPGVNQGVIAFAEEKEDLTLKELLGLTRQKRAPAFLLVLDGIEDPQNFGAILRTADGAGAHGVIIRSRRAAGLTPAAAKASAGAVEYVPVAIVPNIAQAVEELKENNIWTVGIDASAEQEFTTLDFKIPTALVVGAEGKGLSELVRKRCDFLVRIPMNGQISSLNASVAAAVVMYEVVRQRHLP